MHEKQIAMWSVPRSLGTALMRAWSSRSDTEVADEFLALPYIAIKGKDLGLTREDIDPRHAQFMDWQFVVNTLTAPLGEGKSIRYQKHQAYNLIPDIMGTEWILPFANCFLIRQPKDMILSLHRIVPEFTFEELGWAELKWLFEYVRAETGGVPPVIDARDLLNSPQRVLSLLCEAVDVEFSETMLRWPAMNRKLNEKDALWYGSVASSTHFRPYQTRNDPLPEHLTELCKRCDEIYQELYQFRLY
ncbi:MAG: sulfotransferase [Chloroflexota bacterium]